MAWICSECGKDVLVSNWPSPADEEWQHQSETCVQPDSGKSMLATWNSHRPCGPDSVLKWVDRSVPRGDL